MLVERFAAKHRHRCRALHLIHTNTVTGHRTNATPNTHTHTKDNQPQPQSPTQLHHARHHVSPHTQCCMVGAHFLVNKRGAGTFLVSGCIPHRSRGKILVDPAHTRQACNDLGQNVRAGSPKAAGTAIEWPSGSRGECSPVLPSIVYSAGLWLSPTGVGVLLPRLRKRSHRTLVHQGAPSIQRWYELPAAPLLGRLGVFAPLRPLGLRLVGLPEVLSFEPLLISGDSLGVLRAGRVSVQPPSPRRGVALVEPHTPTSW